MQYPNVTDSTIDRLRLPTIAVAIPCFNEAAAIRTVIAQFRVALPGAEIVVFDNNSTDGTADAARDEGVRVEPVPEQGKGHVVRAAFALLGRPRRGRPGRRRRHLSGRGRPLAGRARPGGHGRHGRGRPPARARGQGHVAGSRAGQPS